MNSELKKISNPLTVIGLFAGIAEVAGTIVLPFVSESLQMVFIFYVMFFPVLLVIAFFITLNKNPNVLYAPSDFREEANFMALMQQANIQVQKANEKIQEVDEKVQEAKTSVNSNNNLDVSEDIAEIKSILASTSNVLNVQGNSQRTTRQAMYVDFDDIDLDREEHKIFKITYPRHRDSLD